MRLKYRALNWLFSRKSDFSSKCPYISSTILIFLPNNPWVFTPKIPTKLIFPQIVPIIQALYWLLSQKKWFFPQNAPAYRALFWLFCPIIQCVFTPKIPKKYIFPQIATIIQGTLLTFLPKKLFLSSKCDCISSSILTFLQNNPVFLHQKFSKS